MRPAKSGCLRSLLEADLGSRIRYRCPQQASANVTQPPFSKRGQDCGCLGVRSDRVPVPQASCEGGDIAPADAVQFTEPLVIVYVLAVVWMIKDGQ